MPSVACVGCGPSAEGVATAGVISLLGGINDIVLGTVILPKYTESHWLVAISAAQGGLTAVASCALILGAHQKKANLLLPYSTIMMLGAVSYFTLGTALLVIFDEKMLLDYGIWYYCWTGVVAYFLNVVRLYRIKLLEEVVMVQQRTDLAFRAAAERITSPGSASGIYTIQPRRAQTVSPQATTDPPAATNPEPHNEPQPGTSSGFSSRDTLQEIGWDLNGLPKAPPPPYSAVAPAFSYPLSPSPIHPSMVPPPYPGNKMDEIVMSSKKGAFGPSASGPSAPVPSAPGPGTLGFSVPGTSAPGPSAPDPSAPGPSTPSPSAPGPSAPSAPQL